MRGSNERSGSLFSYVDFFGGPRSRRSSAAHDPGDSERRFERAVESLHGALYRLWAAIDRAGEIASGDAAASVLRHPLRTATDGTVGIRPSVPLVCRSWRGQSGLGPFDLLQEPRPAVGGRDRGEVHGCGLAQPKVKRLLSSDHFSVDGTLIEAWASIKSFRRKDGGDDDRQGPSRNAERNFHKEKRSNETHQSTTDPEARLYKKGDGQPASRPSSR